MRKVFRSPPATRAVTLVACVEERWRFLKLTVQDEIGADDTAAGIAIGDRALCRFATSARAEFHAHCGDGAYCIVAAQQVDTYRIAASIFGDLRLSWLEPYSEVSPGTAATPLLCGRRARKELYPRCRDAAHRAAPLSRQIQQLEERAAVSGGVERGRPPSAPYRGRSNTLRAGLAGTLAASKEIKALHTPAAMTRRGSGLALALSPRPLRSAARCCPALSRARPARTVEKSKSDRSPDHVRADCGRSRKAASTLDFGRNGYDDPAVEHTGCWLH